MAQRPKPLQILCLHGKQQNAAVFRDKISKMVKRCQHIADFTFLDAPHTLPCTLQGDDVAMLSWSKPQNTQPLSGVVNNSSTVGAATTTFNGISGESMTKIAEAMEAQKRSTAGPFNVFFGFSQGCLAILSLLLMPQSSTSAVQGVILAGCPSPLRLTSSSNIVTDEELDKLCAPLRSRATILSSLHILGAKDDITPAEGARRLADRVFATTPVPSPASPSEDREIVDLSTTPQFAEHAHAHSIPQSVDLCDSLESFLEALWRRSYGLDAAQSWGDATKAAIMDEVELLAATYGEDVVTVVDNARECKTLGGVGRCLVVIRVELALAEELFPFSSTHGKRGERSASVQLAIPEDYPAVPPDVTFARLPSSLEDKRKWQVETLTSIARDAASSFAGGDMLMMLVMTVKERIEAGLAQVLAQGGDSGDVPDRKHEEDNYEESPEERTQSIRSAQSYAFRVLQVHSNATQASADDTNATASLPGDEDSLLSPPILNTSEDASTSGGGSWHLTIGLIGKPSAGKSTFFNAVTDPEDAAKAAKVAAFPFTTIEPNIGHGLAPVCCPCSSINSDASSTQHHARCAAELGHVELPGNLICRRIPITVKDVAGLVQGAYRGLGKGNRFLNDLCDADVLVHVVDGAASTDAEGAACKPGEGSATEDVTWVRDEVHSWIFDNLMSKWVHIARRPDRLYGMFSGYRASRALVERTLRLCGVRNPKDAALQLPFWRPQEVHRLVAMFVALRFPIVTALNKCDVSTAFKRTEATLRQLFPHELFVPMSARVEWELLELRRSGDVEYHPGSTSVVVVRAAQPSSSQQATLSTAEKFAAFVHGNGGTGVQQVLLEAIRTCAPLLLYPVDDVRSPPTLCEQSNESITAALRACLVMKRHSTAEDAFRAYARYHDHVLESKKAPTHSAAVVQAGSSNGAMDAAAKYKFVRFEARLAASNHDDEAMPLGPVYVCRRDEPVISGALSSGAQGTTGNVGGGGVGAMVVTTHAFIRVHMNHRSH
ncbi:50S ribosomal binding GTPase, putative [Bodo saltans]|uniref:50S ribosomal binding GTPase, putative n=1 Tax=Bodo saltans TaxID=75058 RepID=A0A0S4IRQ8_BODSA|nr:50S ribosomal binding GTPase, putative [Bodo saltans]|eukprot:CUF40384.1 50S ribosomal binding GTPase, putative [Bodo saltans]